MELESYGQSDVGLVRSRNEDVWQSLPEKRFFALSDGMGGHLGGDIAAAETIGVLCGYVQEEFPPGLVGDDELEAIAGSLVEGIEQANGVVYQLARMERELRGMGATLCCIYCGANRAILAHVGDSRIYRLRNGSFQQMTRDHSLLTEFLESGRISEAEAENFIYKHVITRAVGTRRRVTPELSQVDLQVGDLFLICSDGLTDDVPGSVIGEIVLRKESLQERSSALIEAALTAGGRDNVTVLLIAVK